MISPIHHTKLHQQQQPPPPLKHVVTIVDEERDVLQSPIKHREARSVDTPATFVGLDIKQESIASDESSMTDDSMYTTENDDDDSDDDDDNDDDEEDTSKGTKNLLIMANIRLQQQELREEVKALKTMLHTKDEQLLHLTSQLRRATASKCDLVNAVTDMEREKEKIEQAGEAQLEEVKWGYLQVLEKRADMEREYMNELATLSEQMMTMDRKYKNQLLEKDFSMAKMAEELRRLRQQEQAKIFMGKSVRKVGNVTKA